MAGKAIRFGVRSAFGLRSESWKCWTSNPSKSDVYLACRRIGQIKLSLHESGQWHVGWVGKQDELFDPSNVPKDRLTLVSQRPLANHSRHILACRVFIPSDAVTIVEEVPEPGVIWASAPATGNVIEFQIVLASYPHYFLSWPGKYSGTKLVGYLPLPNKETAYVVVRERSAITLPAARNVAPKPMKGMTRDDMLTGNRAILWGENPDGSISFCETPITITVS